MYACEMPKTCERCGKEFTPRRSPNRPNRFCSRDCYNAAGRGPTKSVTKGRRMRSAPGHPVAPTSGIATVSRLVLYDKIGPGPHPCHWCGAEVAWIVGGGPATPGYLLADHLDWDDQNDAPENLVPSCNHCNAHRTRDGDRRRIQDGELTMMWGGRKTRAVRRVCETCGSEFLTVPAAVKAGDGRYCSRQCMYDRNRKAS